MLGYYGTSVSRAAKSACRSRRSTSTSPAIVRPPDLGRERVPRGARVLVPGLSARTHRQTVGILQDARRYNEAAQASTPQTNGGSGIYQRATAWNARANFRSRDDR